MPGGLEERFAAASAATDPDLLDELGDDLFAVERLGDAEWCYRRAIELDGPIDALIGLGCVVAAQARMDEAVVHLRRALDVGGTAAALYLGHALLEVGDRDGALVAYRIGAEAGDGEAALEVAFELRERGEAGAAVEAVDRAVALGDERAFGVAACWRWDATRDLGLESDLRTGANHYGSARDALADLLRSTDRVDEARLLLERTVEPDDDAGWLVLGNLYLDDLHDPESAERAYRAGIAAGDNNCHHNLGRLLADSGDFISAIVEFELGAGGGDELAASTLSDLRGAGALAAVSTTHLFDWTADEFDPHWAAVKGYIEAVGILEAIETARVWCASDDARRIATGLDTFGVLAGAEAGVVPHLIEAAHAVVRHADEDVRVSAAHALGVAVDPRALDMLLAFAGDEDSDVRWHVAGALPGLVDDERDPPDHPAVEALIKLARDEDGAVRDWATFGLGNQLAFDTPQIRELLLDNLEGHPDDDSDTAGEAALGLARRRDPRVFDVLVRELIHSQVGNLYVEAAGELGDPRLLPLLVDLGASSWREDNEPPAGTLDEAIRLCSGGERS